ncbi:MAG: ATP-binding cassette domain-containing protein, partial [Burkholderiales bacterium]|nr:ATP-binding cassette domain-containing protein [Burkholderiales bacterium]
MLRAEAVDLRVGGRSLVSGLDLIVNRGECWAILGRNGAGKSTLLHVLAGLRKGDAGRVFLQGESIGKVSRREVARHVGVLLQEETRDYWGSTRDYATLGRYPHQQGVFGPRSGDCEVVENALSAMDLAALADRAYRSLSGGERQRARLAALFAQQPGCYLLDEPLQQLDLPHQVAFLDWIWREVQSRRIACLMVLHDLVLANRYCDHLLLLFGDGSYVKGSREEMMTEENLHRLYGFPVEVRTVGQELVF